MLFTITCAVQADNVMVYDSLILPVLPSTLPGGNFRTRIPVRGENADWIIEEAGCEPRKVPVELILFNDMILVS